MTLNARLIAFHLPQFHPIPENDRWWGKGFTEWTNVVKARPLFPGHLQPRLPADLGFYDLRLPEARQAQADLAQRYGVEGFCFYHYWFGSRRILERPVNEIIHSGEPNFPFCLCWANHSWNSSWQGTDSLLIEQTYPGWDDHAAHFDWLLRAFTDRRYVRVNGMPLFVIYRPDDIPELPRVVDFWRTRAQRAGLPGLYLIGVSHRDESWDPRPRSLDASTMQALPHRDGRLPRRYLRKKILHALSGRANELTVWDYRDLHNSLLRQNTIDWRDFPLVLPNWDNTPRAGHRGIVLHDSSPALFSTLLGTAIARVQAHPLQERIIFLKAWNEWAEGNFVEPDVKWGHAWLESIQTKLTEKTPSGQD